MHGNIKNNSMLVEMGDSTWWSTEYLLISAGHIGLDGMNLNCFGKNYYVGQRGKFRNNIMNLRPKAYVQFTPSYSRNLDGKNYVEYCWVSLVRFKEWKGNYHRVYGDMDATDQAIQIKWKDYLREWSASCENGGGQAPYFLQQ